MQTLGYVPARWEGERRTWENEQDRRHARFPSCSCPQRPSQPAQEPGLESHEMGRWGGNCRLEHCHVKHQPRVLTPLLLQIQAREQTPRSPLCNNIETGPVSPLPLRTLKSLPWHPASQSDFRSRRQRMLWNSAAVSQQGIRRVSPGGGNGPPLQYSCLEIPWTEEPGGLHGVPKESDMT